MVDNHVTIFFQGHDHIFVHQQLDGAVYQTLPQPADFNYALEFADYLGLLTILGNVGFVYLLYCPLSAEDGPGAMSYSYYGAIT